VSVARMLKVTVIAHGSISDELVDRLQHAGALEVAAYPAPEVMASDSPEHQGDDETLDSEVGLSVLKPMAIDEDRLHRLDEQIADAQFVRDFLGRFHVNEAPFATFVSEKFHFTREEYLGLDPDGNFIALYRECDRISDRLASLEREVARLSGLIHHLEPWSGLHLQISQWKGSEHVVLFTGTVPEASSQDIRQSLREAIDLVSVAEVGAAGSREAWVVMAHREALASVRSALSLTEFEEVGFPDLQDYPAEESACAAERIVELQQERIDLEERASGLAEKYAHTFALVEMLLSRRDAVEVRNEFMASERAFLISGWLPEYRRDELMKDLAPVTREVDIVFEDPAPGDEVPVELKNPAWMRPFESLTDLYGRPRYGDVDPTPFVAPFFFLFFGICIGDVGYGIVLMLACWLIKTRLDVAPGVKKFMDLFIYGGVASIIAGIPTRSYFALAEGSLPAFLRYTPVLDLPDDATTFLVFSVALGVVHVLLGVLINAYSYVKHGDPGRAAGEISVIVFIASIAVGVLAPDLMTVSISTGAGLLILTKGRIWGVRGPIGFLKSLGGGLLGLYDVVGIASDFISYSRLAALGMASLLVGSVMNDLAAMVGGGGGVAVLAGALIFIVGHTFNIVINLLSAFVHPARLQFVEFFGKFYEGGGRPYRPFTLRQQSVVLHSGTSEAEGGTAK
jgi:V/A-type H+-transporting ATPase subunit I